MDGDISTGEVGMAGLSENAVCGGVKGTKVAFESGLERRVA